MQVIGSKPDRGPGEEWRDTFSILVNLPSTVAKAVANALFPLNK